MAILTTQLEQLENAQLVRRLPDEELVYQFKHALTQESAYESLLLKKRLEIHRHVAQAYERIYSDRLDEFAALLAQQYSQAGDEARTLEYSARAGDRAARLNANAEAIMYYTQALDLARRAPEHSGQLSHLYTARGRALELDGKYERALANYEEMATLARTRDDRALELDALIASATIHSAPTATFDSLQAQALSERALALARELKDRKAEAKILWNLMLLYYFTRRMPESVEVGERSVAIAREFDLREQLAYSLNDIQRAYLVLRQFERAHEASLEARELWRELDNKPMLVDNLVGSAQVYYLAGDYDQVLALCDNAYQLSQSIGNLWGQSYSLMNAGFIYLERGQIEQALATMEECDRLGEQAGFLIAVTSQRGWIAMTYGMLGNPDRGLDFIRQAGPLSARLEGGRTVFEAVLALLYVMNGELDRAAVAVGQSYGQIDHTSDPATATLGRMAAAELALAQQDYSRALGIAVEFLSMLQEWGARPYLTDGLLLKSRALVGQGQTDDAYATLMQARTEAEAVVSRRTLWEIKAMLGDLEKERGHVAAAAALYEQAREVIEFIAAHTPADLRPSFLKKPVVRRVLDAAAASIG